MRIKDQHIDKLIPYFIVLRTPLLPFNEVLNFSSNLETPKVLVNDSPRLSETIPSDRLLLRERLRKIFSSPAVCDALFISSPNFFQQIRGWMIDPDCDRSIGIERKLVSYFMRMTSRPTPFGLFAGCSVGQFSENNRLRIGRISANRRLTRLDMDYLDGLTEAITQLPPIRRSLIYKPNPSIFSHADLIRYIAMFITNGLTGRRRYYFSTTAKITAFLKLVLNRASSGATPSDLAKSITEMAPEVSHEQAMSFIEALISKQILMSDFSPTITGVQALNDIIFQLYKCKAHEAIGIIKILEDIKHTLNKIDSYGVGVPLKRYHEVEQLLKNLPTPVDINRLFQADMVKPDADIALSPHVINNITRYVKLLYHISPIQQDSLASFRDAFTARYGCREVPLCEMLDEEIGIGSSVRSAGLKSEEHDNVDFSGYQPTIDFHLGRREKYLLWKISEAISMGSSEIIFTASDLESLSLVDDIRPLPDSFSATCIIAAKSEEEISSGRYRVLIKSISGPPGAVLLGRFCHAYPELEQNVRKYLGAEEELNPHVVYAEIVHQPQGRSGNVICRPVLRGYEIPLLGRSGAPPDKQIPLSDLLISVRDNRFVLRSAKLGCEVIPRLTSAHVYCNSDNLLEYIFLGALAREGMACNFSWKWGRLEDSLPFLPRISAEKGRLVLSRATWNLNRDEFTIFTKLRKEIDRFKSIQLWRVRRRVPRFAALVDGDKELLIDFHNVLSVETFFETARKILSKNGTCSLVELFPEPDELCVNGPEGNFVHEMIIPFLKLSPIKTDSWAEPSLSYNPPIKTKFRPSTRFVRRTFAPHSEWVYLKLYGGKKILDNILVEDLYPILSDSIRDGIIDQWFYIRYSDPDLHLRIRFHGLPRILNKDFLPIIEGMAKDLLSEGKIYRVQYDSYEREIERYGGPVGVLLAEQLFHADSDASVAIITDYLRHNQDADVRWRLTLLGVHKLIKDFKFPSSEECRLVQNLRDEFANTVRNRYELRDRISQTYREARHQITALLEEKGCYPEYESALQLFNERSERLSTIVTHIKRAARKSALTLTISSLVYSFLHMHINRMLLVPDRIQEFVLYEYLHRFYKSQSARN